MKKLLLLLTLLLILLVLQFTSINPSENITQTEFLNKVENNDVKSVTFVTDAGYAEVELINNASNTPKLHFRYSDIKDVKEQIRLKNSDDYQIIIDSREENRMFGEILSWILPLIFFVIIIISAIGWFKVYKKTGFSGWTSLIPVYRTLILLKIINKPWHWIFLFCIPLVNIVFIIWSMNLLSKNFGKDEGFTVGLLLLPFIFIPILGFDNSEYKKRITK